MKFIAMAKRATRSAPEIRLIIANMNSHLRANERETVTVTGLTLDEMATAGKEYGDLPRRMVIARLSVSYSRPSKDWDSTTPVVWQVPILLNLTDFLLGEEVMLTGTWMATFSGNTYCDAIESVKNSEAPADVKILSEIVLAMSNVIIHHGQELNGDNFPVLQDQVFGHNQEG